MTEEFRRGRETLTGSTAPGTPHGAGVQWQRWPTGTTCSCGAARAGRRRAERHEGLPCSPRCSARCANTAPTSDALYELVAGVDRKVDALDAKVDRRFDEIGGQLVEVLRRLGS